MFLDIKRKAVNGVLWSSVERFSVQGIQFIIMIIMARVLSPADYGLIGMLAIFLAVSQSLVDSGFVQSLVRKKDRTEIDNSTVFYFNVVVGVFLYFILFFSAPLVADFYNVRELVSVTRWIGLSIIINSLVVVQRALLTINIDFKTQARASLIAVVISGTMGITMAYSGFGVWAIVCQQLVNLAINALLLWSFSHWRPLWTYSWKSFHELFAFGSKLLISGLIDTIYRNIFQIVIGKRFSATDLGYYTRARQFSDFPSANLTGILQKVIYPVLCSIQNEDERLSQVYRRFLRLSSFIIFPLLVGLAVVSKPLILLLLNEQWEFTATLLQVICFAMMWYPIHAINLNLLAVKGRSDLFLRLEIIKKAIGISILCITLPMGLIPMCLGQIVASLLSLIINTHYTGKLIHVAFRMQMRDLLPILMLSLTMGGLVYFSLPLFAGNLMQLSAGIFIGLVYYIGISYLLKYPELKELYSLSLKNLHKS
jgi:O-antigen/teichoic acid export membrane protein